MPKGKTKKSKLDFMQKLLLNEQIKQLKHVKIVADFALRSRSAGGWI